MARPPIIQRGRPLGELRRGLQYVLAQQPCFSLMYFSVVDLLEKGVVR